MSDGFSARTVLPFVSIWLTDFESALKSRKKKWFIKFFLKKKCFKPHFYMSTQQNSLKNLLLFKNIAIFAT